jgi:hypothetical protein
LAACATGECLGHVDLLKGDEAKDSGQRVVDDPAIDGPIIYGEHIQLRNVILLPTVSDDKGSSGIPLSCIKSTYYTHSTISINTQPAGLSSR